VNVVSVIIPVWNRAEMIAAAVDSVLTQTVDGWSMQLIIVDDASTDNLAGALRPYGERLACIRHSANKGAAAARNTGIAAAKGDLIAFLDSDDVWLPGKLATQIAFMLKTGYVATCTACHLARPGASDQLWPQYRTGAIARSQLVWGCFLSPGTTMLCRPQVFEAAGVFDTDLARHEDWDWLLRFSARDALGFLAQPLARREPSPYANAQKVLSALQTMEAKHSGSLPGRERRHFKAALSFEAGAAHYREGNWGAALRELIRSVWTVPIGHAGVRALLASRLQGR
jgi:glycosyltransferase involved in cell wall biosynthesis